MTDVMTPSVTSSSGKLKKIRYVWTLAAAIAQREGVGRTKQFKEILRLYFGRQLGPLAYYEQELWRPHLSMRDKLRCMNGIQFEKRVHELNPPEYHCLGNHKVVEAALLKQFGIPAPEYLGFLHSTDGTDLHGRPLTDTRQLVAFLAELCPAKICLKPAEGMEGSGFVAMRIEQRSDGLVAVDVINAAKLWPLDRFLEDNVAPGIDDGLIIQRYIQQHPRLAAINPSSVNTLRIWALQCRDTVHIRGALLRMGRAGQPVDNSSRGGVLAPVDLDTGRLRQVKTATVFPEFLSCHPDTGAQVEGVEVPHWKACIDLAKATVRALPGMRFSGLDIAVTESGPLVVETNPHPHPISARNFGAPTADLLDCSFSHVGSEE